MSKAAAPAKAEAPKAAPVLCNVEVDGSVLQQIRQHARGSMKAEICGVLIGSGSDDCTRIVACIAGENASQGGAHVTYTQETWEHIYKIKDAEFPDLAIVGWYHSHPGFGVFLSDYDLFIHQNFFSSPNQVAWVFDPHSDEEGCFGWSEGKVVPLSRISVVRQQKVTDQPEVGRPEPEIVRSEEEKVEKQEPARKSGWLGLVLQLGLAAVILFVVFEVGLSQGFEVGQSEARRAIQAQLRPLIPIFVQLGKLGLLPPGIAVDGAEPAGDGKQGGPVTLSPQGQPGQLGPVSPLVVPPSAGAPLMLPLPQASSPGVAVPVPAPTTPPAAVTAPVATPAAAPAPVATPAAGTAPAATPAAVPAPAATPAAAPAPSATPAAAPTAAASPTSAPVPAPAQAK